MHKLLVFVFAVAGCRAGVLHHGYTAPVIQQYVDVVPQQQILSYSTPAQFVYAAPTEGKKAPVQRQRLVKKQKQVQPAPESFSYQIRVQHAEKSVKEEKVSAQQEYLVPIHEIPQTQPVIGHYDYPQFQTIPYQTVQFTEEAKEEKPAAARRPMKSARIQSKASPDVQAKEKTIDYTLFPQYTPVQYTPVIYYYPGVSAGHPVNPPKKPVQPQEPEEEEDVQEEEDGLETFDRFQAAEEEEVKEDTVEVKKVPKNVPQISHESPFLAYQAFNAGW